VRKLAALLVCVGLAALAVGQDFWMQGDVEQRLRALEGVTAALLENVKGLAYEDLAVTGGGVASTSVGIEDIQFNPDHVNSEAVANLHWNSDDGTFEFGLPPDATVNLQIGQEQVVFVRNDSGADIPNGSLVSVVTVAGSQPFARVTLTDVTDPDSFKGMVGLTTQTITKNLTGYVTTFGLVRDLDTSSFTGGDIVFASLTPGGLQANTPPAAPAGGIAVGIVMRSHASEGIILVRPQLVLYMANLSDVYLTALPTDGQFLSRNAAQNRWEIDGPDHTTGAEPTCDATLRGQINEVQGGAGVADTLKVCSKNSSDTYAWYPLATIP
jgi:hypothetical protein